jgi:type VI protein secretion system component Hcp
MTLEEVCVARVSPRLVYRGDGFVLMEEVALTFAKIKWEHWDKEGQRTDAQWNLKTNSET